MNDTLEVVDNVELSLKTKIPGLYRVMMHSDEYTPGEFVIGVLEKFFTMDRTQATAICHSMRSQGSAVCGTFTRDVAETKAYQVVEHARQHEHPLLCSVEGL